MKLSVSFKDAGQINKDVLISLFENYGSVRNVKVFRTLNNVSKSTLAIVEMHSEIESERALKSINGLVVDGVTLKVEVSKDWVRGKSTPISSESQPRTTHDLDDDYNKDDEEDYNNESQNILEIADDVDEPDIEYSW